jgi:probable phosphoglycerate mutase
VSVKPPEGLRTTSDPVEGATTIVLVRHGQGNCNVSGKIGGPIGCTGLTELGAGQVSDLARRLEKTRELEQTSALYASVLPRAIETAELLASALDIDRSAIEKDCELCELHPGEGDGLIWEEFVERFGAKDWDLDPSLAFAPGGESWLTFVDRATRAIERIAQRHKGERVVIATHAGVIEASMLQWVRSTIQPFDGNRLRLPTKHASITEWEYANGSWRLVRYNDAAHAASTA